MNELNNKVILITGAANGIGRESAIGLADLGAIIIAADIDSEGLASLLDEAQEKSLALETTLLDVTSEQQWQDVIQGVGNKHGRLDVLINNAGVIQSKPLLQTSLDEYERIMNINTKSVFIGSKAAVPLMLDSVEEGKTGSIINVSSILGLVVSPFTVPYCASKGAVRHLSKALAAELAMGDKKIRVNSLHPGNTETKLCATVIEQSFEVLGMPEAPTDEGYQLLAQQTPMQRNGLPQDMIGAMAFLASDMSQFVTGAELVVDGGFVIT